MTVCSGDCHSFIRPWRSQPGRVWTEEVYRPEINGRRFTTDSGKVGEACSRTRRVAKIRARHTGGASARRPTAGGRFAASLRGSRGGSMSRGLHTHATTGNPAHLSTQRERGTGTASNPYKQHTLRATEPLRSPARVLRGNPGAGARESRRRGPIAENTNKSATPPIEEEEEVSTSTVEEVSLLAFSTFISDPVLSLSFPDLIVPIPTLRSAMQSLPLRGPEAKKGTPGASTF